VLAGSGSKALKGGPEERNVGEKAEEKIMPRIQFNGDETPEAMPLPPVGVPVDFEVAKVEMKESKSGKPMLEVQMTIIGTEAAGDSMWDYFTEPTSSKRTQIALKRMAAAVGVKIGADGLESEELLGRTGQFVLKAENYQGKERRRISDYVVLEKPAT